MLFLEGDDPSNIHCGVAAFGGIWMGLSLNRGQKTRKEGPQNGCLTTVSSLLHMYIYVAQVSMVPVAKFPRGQYFQEGAPCPPPP